MWLEVLLGTKTIVGWSGSAHNPPEGTNAIQNTIHYWYASLQAARRTSNFLEHPRSQVGTQEV